MVVMLMMFAMAMISRIDDRIGRSVAIVVGIATVTLIIVMIMMIMMRIHRIVLIANRLIARLIVIRITVDVVAGM